jgi:carbonic anhydrase
MGEIDLSRMSAETALARLLQGNRRFAGGASIHPHQDRVRRRELLAAQRPYAAILTCADSRVAPELVFDQGFGDIFVVRNGGNIGDEIAAESLEFAVGTWAVPLIVVMGHENCGAVAGTLAGIDAGLEPGRLFGEIGRAIARVADGEGDRMRNAVIANVQYTVAKLQGRPYFAELLTRGEVTILAAYYSIESGAVQIL